MNYLPRTRFSSIRVGRRLDSQAARSVGVSPTSVSSDGDHNWWMITLSDLTLLLLGFLALWYLTVKSEFHSAPPLHSPSADAQSPKSERSAPAPALSAENWREVGRELEIFIRNAGLVKDVTIESSHRDIVLSLRDHVPFASGKADLQGRALPVLEKIAALVLAQSELSVAISGHTDSLRIATAEFPSNWELSTARASRVARYLIVKGIHPSRISVQGYANYRPREPNATASSRSRNRRVEIRLFQQTVAREVR